jgi:hypothetical protein
MPERRLIGKRREEIIAVLITVELERRKRREQDLNHFLEMLHETL